MRPVHSTLGGLSGLGMIVAAVAVVLFVLTLYGEVSWLAFVLGVAATALAAVGVGWLQRRRLRALAEFAERASGGPAGIVSVTGYGRLVAAVRQLVRTSESARRRAAQQARTNAQIVENLPVALLLLDNEGEVAGANVAARDIFGDRLIGRDISDIVRTPLLLDAINDIFTGAARREVEFELPVPVSRTFKAVVEHLPHMDGPLEQRDGDGPAAQPPAVLVLLHDLTAMRRTEQLRGEFVADVSHELRTPLSTVIGIIETLRTTAKDDPEAQARFLGLMDTEGQRMARLIDDLLSLSRIELDEHLPPEDQVDLADIVTSVMESQQQRASSRDIRLVAKGLDSPAMINGDADQVQEVLENLVENAIRHSKDGSRIEVTISRAAQPRRAGAEAGVGSISMAVRDRGEGIAREHLPRITERFYRVDRARSRAQGGTGLGLAIVKHIVSRHRAVLDIDSELGVGSTFTVHWPAAGGDEDEAAHD